MATLASLKIEFGGRDQDKGESTDTDGRDWLEVLEFRTRVAASVTTTGVKQGTPAQLISFRILLDRPMPALFEAVASQIKIKRIILHIVETKRDDRTVVESEVWWEFLDVQVKSTVLHGSQDLTGGSASGKHTGQYDSRITVEVSFVYKSISHRYGPSKPDNDNWVGAAAKPAAVGVTAGMAAATHMLRQYQTRLS